MGSANAGSAPAITVLLVDEDAMFRRGVREILEDDGIVVVGEARAAEEAIASFADLAPDLVLMAVEMQRVSGVEATRAICETTPRCRVLILSNSSRSADTEAALGAGACGYLLKDDSPDEIVAGVRAAALGGSPLSPRVTASLLERMLDGPGNGSTPDTLTAREKNVLELLSDGRSNSQISEDLSISVSTVKRHVSHLFEKLGVENRTQAAVVATRQRLL
jgi:DNA-binding NarL/FixJ family response regulator